MKRVLWQMSIAVCHVIVGLISLSIAIPPGFSSPIWPASAIVAVAFWKLGRHAVLPILISAFVLNFISKGFADLEPMLFMSCAVIAVGTVLQGAVSGVFARYLERKDPRMSHPGLVFKVLALLIFASCLINSSFSVTALTLFGLIPSESYAPNWFTWWMGDAMGMAILFCPLFLAFSSSGAYERKRSLSVSLLSASLLILFVPLYLLVVRQHERTYIENISSDAERLVQRIELIRTQNEAVVTLVASMKGSVPGLTSTAFMYIAAPLVDEFPAIQALEWAPRVAPESKVEFETLVRQNGHPDFHIFSMHEDDETILIQSAKKDDFYPVTYISPMDGNESALGLNLASESNRGNALLTSIELDQPSTTKPIVLVQEMNDKSFAYLTFAPVYPRGSRTPDSCVGVILGVFRFDDIVQAAVADERLNNFDFVLRDSRDPEKYVFTSFEDGPPDANESQQHELASLTLAMSLSSPWEVEVFPSVDIYDFSNWWQVWLLLFVGALLIYLGVYYFTIISAQPELVKRKIDEKTSELQVSTTSLKELNEKLEDRVSERTTELTDANKELNLFVSAVSHDLRAPLAKLNMFVTTLQKSYGGTEQSVDTSIALGAIKNATHSMTHLISGMLELSRKTHQEIKVAEISIDEIIHLVLVELESEIRSSGIVVDWEPLPTLWGDQVLLTQLYTNLISNAIKFTSKVENPNVRISTRNTAKKDEIVMTVEDNGVGVPHGKRQEIFTAFSRVHSNSEFPGSGIGLSICERIVKRLDGRIWVEDSDLGGAKFCFVLKVVQTDQTI